MCVMSYGWWLYSNHSRLITRKNRPFCDHIKEKSMYDHYQDIKHLTNKLYKSIKNDAKDINKEVKYLLQNKKYKPTSNKLPKDSSMDIMSDLLFNACWVSTSFGVNFARIFNIESDIVVVLFIPGSGTHYKKLERQQEKHSCAHTGATMCDLAFNLKKSISNILRK